MRDKKKDFIPCTDCLPISNLNGHKTLYGILIHSRTDCPTDVVYMINDKYFETNPDLLTKEN